MYLYSSYSLTKLPYLSTNCGHIREGGLWWEGEVNTLIVAVAKICGLIRGWPLLRVASKRGTLYNIWKVSTELSHENAQDRVNCSQMTMTWKHIHMCLFSNYILYTRLNWDLLEEPGSAEDIQLLWQCAGDTRRETLECHSSGGT